MAKNRWFGTWVLATLSLLGISRKLCVARTTQAGTFRLVGKAAARFDDVELGSRECDFGFLKHGRHITCCPIILPAVRLYRSTPSDFRRYVDRREAHRRKADGDQED